IDPCLGIERRGRIRGGARIDDAAVAGSDQAVIDQAEASALRRQRRKTAVVPDVIDRGHEAAAASAHGRLASPLICLYILALRCPAFRAGPGGRCERTVLRASTAAARLGPRRQ